MSCDELHIHFIEYIEDTLADQEKRRVETHLDSCFSCREEVVSMREVLEGSRQVDFGQPSPVYWNNYLPRLREKIDKKQAKPWYARRAGYVWAGVAATIIAVFLLIRFIDLDPSSGQNFAEEENLEYGFSDPYSLLFEEEFNDNQVAELGKTVLEDQWEEYQTLFEDEDTEDKTNEEEVVEFGKTILEESWETYQTLFEDNDGVIEDEIEKMTDEEFETLYKELEETMIIETSY